MNRLACRLAVLVFAWSLCACAQSDVIAREIKPASDHDAGTDAGSDAGSNAGTCRAALCSDFEQIAGYCEDPRARLATGDGCSADEPGVAASRFALCTCTELVTERSLTLDGWDSREGAFSASSELTPEIGSGADCACAAAQQLDIAALVAAHEHDNDDAAQSIDPKQLDGFDGTSTDAILELGCGRFYLDAVHGKGLLRLHVTGHALVFIAGDLAVDDDFEVLLEPNAALDLFVAGNVRASKKLSLGDEESASRARLYVAGNGTIDIGGDALIAGSLYAPRAELVTRGSFTAFGPVFVRRAAPLGDVVLHFDLATREPVLCSDD